MKKHILATAALACFAIAANAEVLTVHHRTQGQLAKEITDALTEAGLEASQVTELTVISDVVDEKQVPLNIYSYTAGGAEDCAAIRSNFRPSLKKVDFSQAVFDENSTGVPQNDDLFMVNMTSLEEVILPETLASLGGGSFKGCTKLVNVNMPASLRTIGKRAFLNCKSLKLAELPDQIRYIGDEAFNDGKASASWIAFTKMPSGIETIKGNAFNNTNVSFSELPEGLVEIGDKAFRNTKVTFTKAPSTLKTLGNAAFVNAPITEFTIDGCLETSIPNQTFWCGDKTPRTFYCRATTPPTTSASMVTTEYANAFGPDNVPYITFYVPFDAMAAYNAKAPYNKMKLAALTADVELILDGEEGAITVAHQHHGNLAKGINSIYEGEHEWTFTPGTNNYIASIALSGDEPAAVAEADDTELLTDANTNVLYTADGTPENLEKQPVTITVPVTASTRSLTVTYSKVKDLPTGVDSIDAIESEGNADGPVYNLAGLRVAESSAALSTLPRGIYIVRTAKGARKVAL